jgi:hypothetical protein
MGGTETKDNESLGGENCVDPAVVVVTILFCGLTFLKLY